MSLYDQIDEWTGHADMLRGSTSRPEISLDDALALHREAVEKRKAAEVEERAAREVYDAKVSAAAAAVRREKAAAAILVEASAEGVAPATVGEQERRAAYIKSQMDRRAAKDGVPGCVPIVDSAGEIVGYDSN